MMTLDESIKWHEQMAAQCHWDAEIHDQHGSQDLAAGARHDEADYAQTADWLKELRAYRAWEKSSKACSCRDHGDKKCPIPTESLPE